MEDEGSGGREEVSRIVPRPFGKSKAEEVEKEVEELEDEMKEMITRMAFLEAEVYGMMEKK